MTRALLLTLSLGAAARAQIVPVTPKIVLPTWQEVQQERLRRDLAPRPEAAPAAAAPLLSPARANGQRRLIRTWADATLSRPLPRLGLGAGAGVTEVLDGDQRRLRDTEAHLSLRLDLSRRPPRARWLTRPRVDYARTEVGPSEVRVTEGERALDSLKRMARQTP